LIVLNTCLIFKVGFVVYQYKSGVIFAISTKLVNCDRLVCIGIHQLKNQCDVPVGDLETREVVGKSPFSKYLDQQFGLFSLSVVGHGAFLIGDGYMQVSGDESSCNEVNLHNHCDIQSKEVIVAGLRTSADRRFTRQNY
jgi:hypothetical protein